MNVREREKPRQKTKRGKRRGKETKVKKEQKKKKKKNPSNNQSTLIMVWQSGKCQGLVATVPCVLLPSKRCASSEVGGKK